MTEESNNNQSNGHQKKSGQQIGKENVKAAREYVKDLKLQKKPLPSRKGKPNWSAIALACGFDRGVFYDNDEARAVIEGAAEDTGLDTGLPVENGKAAHTQTQLDKSERHKQELERRLAVKIAENETLKQENKELKEGLRRFSAFEEVMTSNGRRFIP